MDKDITPEIKDAAGINKAAVALDVIVKLYYNGQEEDGEAQGALVSCITILNKVIRTHTTIAQSVANIKEFEDGDQKLV